MRNYTKKPVTIQAVQYNGENIKEIKDFAGENLKYNPSTEGYVIATLEGEMFLNESDYVIRGIKGEFYPCREDIFKLTYDEESLNDDDSKTSEKKIEIFIDNGEVIKMKIRNLMRYEVIGLLRYNLIGFEKMAMNDTEKLISKTN